MNDYDEIKKTKEDTDRYLLRLESVLAYTSTLSFLAFILVASYFEMPGYMRIILIALGSVILAVGIAHAIKIEQIAGYYECGICHHKYVPSYKSVFFSSHIGRTRHLRCPLCNKKSWSKKVLTK